MSMSNVIVNIRMTSEMKRKAEAVFEKLGIGMSDAVRMFLAQVELQNGLPFDVKIPNKSTRKAIEELDAGKGRRLSLEQWEAENLSEQAKIKSGQRKRRIQT